MDANSRADQQKNCEEFFTCPYSIKDSMKINKILDLGQFYQTYAKLCNLFVLLLPLYTRKILLRSGQCDLYWWWKIYWGKIICHGFNHTYFKGYLFPLKKRTNEKTKSDFWYFALKRHFSAPLQFGPLSSARRARDHIPDQTSRPPSKLNSKFCDFCRQKYSAQSSELFIYQRPISLSRTFLSTLSASSAVEHGVSTKY